jgi:hypothetical protein
VKRLLACGVLTASAWAAGCCTTGGLQSSLDCGVGNLSASPAVVRVQKSEPMMPVLRSHLVWDWDFIPIPYLRLKTIRTTHMVPVGESPILSQAASATACQTTCQTTCHTVGGTAVLAPARPPGVTVTAPNAPPPPSPPAPPGAPASPLPKGTPGQLEE